MSIFKGLIGDGIGTILSGAKDIISQFKADPNKVLEAEQKLKDLENKAKEIENNLIISLEQEASKQLETVNETMREEAKSEHFLVYSWRPIIGYTFAAMLINNYILYPYLHQYGALLLPIPMYVWVTLGSILGVTAVGRTLEKLKVFK